MYLTAFLLAATPLAPLDDGRLAQTPPSAGPTSDEEEVKVHFFGKEQRAPLPYELANGVMVFKASIAGRDVWVMLDNRAERSVIDTALARSQGLAIAPPSGKFTTPTGELPMQRVSDVPIVIPGQLEVRAPLAAVDLAPFSTMLGRKVEAIFGGDYLGHFQVIANSGRQTLQFLPTGMAQPPASFPLVTLKSARPQIEVRIGTETLLLTLDMGMNGDMGLTPSAWMRVKPKDAVFTSRGVAALDGKLHMADHSRLPEIAIGPVSVKDVEVGVQPWPVQDGDGILGMGTLRRFDFVLDIKAGKLWLVPRLPSSVAR